MISSSFLKVVRRLKSCVEVIYKREFPVGDCSVKKAVESDNFKWEGSKRLGVSFGERIRRECLRNVPVPVWKDQASFTQLIRLLEIMGKGNKGGFYAVARGRNVGIFKTWDECKAQVNGFPNARYKKFPSSGEADAFIAVHRGPGATVKSSTSTSTKSAGTSSLPGASSDPKASSSSFKGSSLVGRGTILLENGLLPKGMLNPAQKRSLSKTASLKVTEDRVINKRVKLGNEVPNYLADLSQFTVDEDGYVVVFTDGACSKNGRSAAKAGIGVWFGHDHSLNISEPVNGRQTNNTAEIQAAERAIWQAKVNGVNKLKVKTDSQFTINCVTKWINNWKRNKWKLSSGGEVKNKDDLIKLDNTMQNMEIKWSYVAGHAGIEGNEAADRLAVAGAERSNVLLY